MASSMEDLMVRIQGDASSLLSALRQAQTATQGAAASIQAAGGRIEGISASLVSAGKALQAVGGNITSVGKSLSLSLTLPIAGLGAVATKTFANFETQIVRATSLVRNISPDEIKAMSEEARRLGAVTRYTAAQAAEGMQVFARAGKRPHEVIAAMEPTLNLATAEMMSIADAAGAASDVMAGLMLNAGQLEHAIDVLGVASVSSRTSVMDLAMGIRWAGPSARAVGVSLEDLTATLEVLAEAGIPGAQAGRGLRTVFTRLAAPTKEAQVWLDRMGISLFNAEGRFVGVQESINQLSAGFATLTDQERVAASADIAGVFQSSLFMNLVEVGAEKFGEFRGQLEGVKGTIKGIAEKQLATLSGQFVILMSAVEGAAIEFVYYFQPALMSVLKGAQDLIAAWRELSPELKYTIGVLLGVAAAAGPVLVVVGLFTRVVGTALVGLGSLGGVLSGVGVVFARMAAGVVMLLNPLKLATTLFAGWLAVVKAAAMFIVVPPWLYIFAAGVMIERSWSDMTKAVGDAWKNITTFVRDAFTIARLIVENFGEIASAVLLELQGAWEGIKKSTKDVVAIIDTIIEKLGDFFSGFVEGAAAGAVLALLAVAKGLEVVLGALGSAVTWVKEFFGGLTGGASGASVDVAELGAAIGAMTGAVVASYVAYRTLKVVVGVLWLFLNMLHIPIVVQTALWLAWKAVVLTVTAVVAAAKFVIFGLTTAMGLLQLAMAMVAAVVLAPVFVVIAAAVWSAWEALKAGASALSDLAGVSTGPLNLVTDIFGQWADMLRDVIAVAKNDMPTAWKMLQIAAQIAIEQIKLYWEPLWSFIQGGFAAVWDFTVAKLKANFTEATRWVRETWRDALRTFAEMEMQVGLRKEIPQGLLTQGEAEQKRIEELKNEEAKLRDLLTRLPEMPGNWEAIGDVRKQLHGLMRQQAEVTFGTLDETGLLKQRENLQRRLAGMKEEVPGLPDNAQGRHMREEMRKTIAQAEAVENLIQKNAPGEMLRQRLEGLQKGFQIPEENDRIKKLQEDFKKAKAEAKGPGGVGKVLTPAQQKEAERLQKELAKIDKGAADVNEGLKKMADSFNAVGRFGVEAFDRITEHIAMMSGEGKKVEKGVGAGAEMADLMADRRQDIVDRLGELGIKPPILPAGVIPPVAPPAPMPGANPVQPRPVEPRMPPGGPNDRVEAFLARIANAVEAANKKAGIRVEGAGLA